MEKRIKDKSARKIMAIADTIATILFVGIITFMNYNLIANGIDAKIEIPNEWRIQYGAVMAFYFTEKMNSKVETKENSNDLPSNEQSQG